MRLATSDAHDPYFSVPQTDLLRFPRPASLYPPSLRATSWQRRRSELARCPQITPGPGLVLAAVGGAGLESLIIVMSWHGVMTWKTTWEEKKTRADRRVT